MIPAIVAPEVLAIVVGEWLGETAGLRPHLGVKGGCRSVVFAGRGTCRARADDRRASPRRSARSMSPVSAAFSTSKQ